MTKQGLTITSLLLFAALSAAQPPNGNGPSLLPTPGKGERNGAAIVPVLDPKDRLDSLLMAWEKRMTEVQSIYVPKLMRTETTKTGKKVFEGEGRFLHPSYAALRLIQRDNPGLYEMFICTGNFIYEYRPQYKKLVIHELERPATGTFNNNFLQFLFGMSAADAKQRYELKIAKDISADNPHYIYLDVKPRLTPDKQEFTQAQMVLFAKTMLPRRLWFQHPNGDQVLWDLPNVDTTTQLKPVDFSPPAAPAGWETKREPKITTGVPASNPNPPRVIRQSPRR